MSQDTPLPPALPVGPAAAPSPTRPDLSVTPTPVAQPKGELGGRPGPEPTRFGDWEVGGRCTDF